MMRSIRLSLIALACIAAFVDQASAQSSQPEELYLARSVRETRVPAAEFCSRERAGFSATTEDRYTFRSMALGPMARVTDANVQTVGDIHACFGSPSGNQILFYAEGQLSGVSFKGIGDCLIIKLNFPEQGINVYRCWLDLSDLPAQYVGGVLTTSTLNSMSKLIGTETIPAGYTQASIATVRLWKKR
jgi:hypothetical protein